MLKKDCFGVALGTIATFALLQACGVTRALGDDIGTGGTLTGAESGGTSSGFGSNTGGLGTAVLGSTGGGMGTGGENTGGAPVTSASTGGAIATGGTTPVGHNPTIWPNADTGGGCNPAPYAEVTSIAVGPTGEIYLAGTYGGAADFGSGTLPVPPNAQLFLAKFDSQGIAVWAQAFAGNQANVKVDHLGRPVLAATSIIETSSGGMGKLRQFESDSGQIRWEYDYSWPAGAFASQIAIEAGDSTFLAIPGSLSAFDSKGDVLWSTPIVASSGGGQAGYPIELVETESGQVNLFMVDYVTWAPLIFQYRLTAYDPQGKQRWTRRLEGNINQLMKMTGSLAGNTAIFGTAYGDFGIEGAPHIPFSGPDTFLGIVNATGGVIAQQELTDLFPQAGTWRTDKLMLASVQYTSDISDTFPYHDAAIGISTLDTNGNLESTSAPALAGLRSPSVLIATQGDRLLVAGTRDNVNCADCMICFQPRPYMMRLDANGVRDQSFWELMP